MFKPKTIRSGENLGVIDIAIRRPDFRQQPSELTSVHIENTDAVISTGVIGIWNTFNEQFRIKNCLLAAIEYDGTWNMTVDEKYVFYTIGEPYIVYVNNKMELLIQQGQGTPTRLATGHITSISCTRGWKNIHETGVDQGFVVSYIKDGLAYYKSYYEDETGTRVWSPETQLEQLGSNLKNIRVNRSNDFRLIFTVTTTDNKGLMAISDRCFGGFSIRGEYISASVFAPDVTVKHIIEHNANSDTDIVRSNVGIESVYSFKGGKLDYISAFNNGVYEIVLFTDVELKYNDINKLRQYLTFTDGNNNALYYSNIIKQSDHLLFKMLNMKDVVGDITIEYKSGNNALLGMTNVDIPSFKFTFTPTDIVGTVGEAPTIVNAFNTTGKSITLELNGNVTGSCESLLHSFVISSIEDEYVHGPSFTRFYKPLNVTVEGNIINITFDDANSFNNARSSINIDYYMSRGDLIDDNENRVKTQSISFEPTNLEYKPNPNARETVKAGVYSVISSAKLIDPIKVYNDETDLAVANIHPVATKITPIGEIRP